MGAKGKAIAAPVNCEAKRRRPSGCSSALLPSRFRSSPSNVSCSHQFVHQETVNTKEQTNCLINLQTTNQKILDDIRMLDFFVLLVFGCMA